jgi:hypothetical protein
MDEKELKAKIGLGSCGENLPGGPGCDADTERAVYRLLCAGSPRLALARAMCVPFQPTLYNVRATFASTSQTDIPDVGADDKFSQDTLIDTLICTVTNGSTQANSNSFQTLSDFFYNFQSGITAKLQVLGAPKYSVASRFTPLKALADLISGNSHWPYGWILGLGQQILMDFHAFVPVPYAPIEVVCTFRGWIPTTDMFNQANMSARDATALLEHYGFKVPQGYYDRACK